MLASDGVFAMKIVAFFFSGELLIRAAPLIVSVVPAWAATSSVLTPTPVLFSFVSGSLDSQHFWLLMTQEMSRPAGFRRLRIRR